MYPKATVRALPLLWLGSGLGAWMLGNPGSVHLGASGVTHGLMFLLASLGLLRRDRAAIATGLIGMLFYGGMLMTILPHADGVSWQSHMGGAFASSPRCCSATPIRCRRASATAGKTKKTRPSRWPTTSWSRRHRSACRCCGSRARARTTW